MDEKQLRYVMGHLAETLVPGDVDLWPAIRVRFGKSHEPTHKIWHERRRDLSKYANLLRDRRSRLVAAALLTLTILAALVIVTPLGQAWAQEILRFFTRAESDSLPVQSRQLTPLSTPGAPTPDPSSIIDASLTVEVVEGQAGFDVLEPAWLPEVLTFSGASLEPQHTIVRIFYFFSSDEYGPGLETNGLVLREEPFQITDDCELCGEVGASAAVETVQIGGVSGEYVQGVWKLTDNGQIWESDPYLQTLRWQSDGMAFELRYMGHPETVSEEDMIAIAESLR